MIQFAPKVIALFFLNNNLERSYKIQAQLVKLCFPYFFKYLSMTSLEFGSYPEKNKIGHDFLHITWIPKA